jgi:hypothetical protein
MSPLLPRHRPFPFQPVLGLGFCLRLVITGSASGTRHLRGYLYVHISYNLDSCSPCLAGLCRWASERSVSPSPCHPSYMALAFTMTGLPPVRKHCPSLGTQLPLLDTMLCDYLEITFDSELYELHECTCPSNGKGQSFLFYESVHN